MPMRNMDMPVLHWPRARIVLSRKGGRPAWAAISTRPAALARIQGLVSSFSATFFFSRWKKPTPADHMKMRWGMRYTEASMTPWEPQIPSATGIPRKPALEHRVPYFITGRLSRGRRRYSAAPRARQNSWLAMDTASMEKVLRSSWAFISIWKEATMLQGRIRSRITSVSPLSKPSPTTRFRK